MYHGQPSETTEGSLNARVERLPWINERVARLLGVRRPDGRRILQTLHLALLVNLHLRFPNCEATITRDEMVEWLDECHPDTPRRLLCDLRRAGLLSYERKPPGVFLQAPIAAQPRLPLTETNPGDPNPGTNPGITSTDSENESRSANSRSLSGSGTYLSKIATNQRASARAHGEGHSNGEGLPDFLGDRMAGHVLPRLKAIRLRIIGRQRLSLGEIESLKALFASGVRLAEFEQAVESTLHTHAAKGVKTRITGLAYFIPEAEEIHRGNLADQAFLAPVAPTTTETPHDAGTNGRRDPGGAGPVAPAARQAGGARFTNGRRSAPERRESPISEEQAQDRQRRTDEALRRYLGPVAGGRTAGETLPRMQRTND